MRYKQRFRHATRRPAAFLRRHHRQSAYRMREARGWGLGAGRTERQGDKEKGRQGERRLAGAGGAG
jgi:hypothetical protein